MQIHQVVDVLIFAASFYLAFKLRTSPVVIEFLHLPPFDEHFSKYIWFYLVLMIASPLVLESQGFYDRPMLCPRRHTIWPLLKGCILATVGLYAALFLFKFGTARWIPIGFGVISFALLYLKEEILQWLARRQLAKGFKRRFILIGTSGDTDHLRREMKTRRESSMEIVAELDLNEMSMGRLLPMLHDEAINGVILSARHTNFEQAEAIIKACELEGVETWLVADFFRTQISRAAFDDFYGHPVMVFRSTPETSWQGVIKNIFDFFGALILLLLLTIFPIIPIVALLIKLTSPGPILFRQLRSGLNGAPFTIYKFRTMVTNAEQRKHELEAMNEMRGPVFKVSKDPRITPIGKWLRRFSIDEFPQLFNVLRGEMSLVGPRPLPIDEVKRFNDMAHRRRLSVRPGLTCLWQVSGRNEIKEFKDWVRLDLQYIDNWSLWLDFKILLRTIPVVFIGTGAK